MSGRGRVWCVKGDKAEGCGGEERGLRECGGRREKEVGEVGGELGKSEK